MTRGLGEISIVHSLPEILVAIAALVTQFGDMAFVLLSILGIYWIGLRDPSLTDTLLRDCLYLCALAIGAYTFTVLLKHVFTLPRPPGATVAIPPVWLPEVIDPIYEAAVTSDGYGFPSGHTLKATVVYVGAAQLLTKWERHRQYLTAAVIVGLVATSRIVLGVHYLVDVVFGLLFGLVFLESMNRATNGDPRRAFAITAVISLISFLMALGYTSGLAVVGAVLGLGFWEFNRRDDGYVPG